MTPLFYAAALLLALKIVANLVLPYWLLLELARTRTRSRSVSLLPSILIEWILLFVLFVVSFGADAPGVTPIRVVGTGAAAILLSYLHFAVVGFGGGWLISRSTHLLSYVAGARGRGQTRADNPNGIARHH